MDSTESTVEISEEELLEPLIITEDGDLTETVPEGDTTSSLDVVLQSCTEESAVKKKEEHSEEDEKKEAVASERYSEEQLNTVDVHKAEADEPAGDVNRNDGQNTDAQEDHRVEIKRFHSFERKIQRNDDQDEDAKKAHRLTPEFPEALYDLLCTLQEGRRLNDQRCSFRLEDGITRRRCHSEPNTRKPANRVVFSSMTSLQKEEFFDLVATAQARRLDDQRAQLGRSAAPKPKGRSFRGSLKQLSIVKKPEPVPVPKEDLYDMILTTQAQGRLEDQRSRAPGPMDDEDFFSLLLRVQGGRMDEQRTELPCLLQT